MIHNNCQYTIFDLGTLKTTLNLFPADKMTICDNLIFLKFIPKFDKLILAHRDINDPLIADVYYLEFDFSGSSLDIVSTKNTT
jgi:hypothetical protein